MKRTLEYLKNSILSSSDIKEIHNVYNFLKHLIKILII